MVGDEEPLHRMLVRGANAVRDGEVHYMAFYSSSYPYRISVDRAEFRTAEESLETWGDGNGIARIDETRKVRALTFDPRPPLEVEAVPENGNDAHAEIVADEEQYSKNSVKTKVCRRLAAIACVVQKPTS